MALDVGLADRVRRRLANETTVPTPMSVAHALKAEQQVVGSETVLQIVDLLREEALGAGVLEPLLRTPGVTDVLVNGASGVYVDSGSGLERSEVRFADDEQVRRLAQRLAASAGRRLDDASPWVDARLPDGTRLHAVLSPLARPGTLISLRVPARRSFSLEQLCDAGTLTLEGQACLRDLIQARASFVVSGGTGSGKTTLLAALLACVDDRERLVVVEDATELRPCHPHVVGLEGRPANSEGVGLVTVRDLVRQALRMRPDRLVVGEVRGAEVVDMLAALNTGHSGGCGTIHANSAADVPARFEALGVSAGLTREAVHSQVLAGVQAVVHVERDQAGRRALAQIAMMQARSSGLVQCVPAIQWQAGQVRRGPAFDDLQRITG